MATRRAISPPVLLLSVLLLALALVTPVVPSSAEHLLSKTNASATPTPAAPAKPGYTAAPCPFKLPAGQVEGKTVQCGYLAVPQDRTDPKSPLIRLAVATFRNPATKVEKDPVIYLGGPGENGLEMLDMALADLIAPVFAANRDLVIFDQRGVGLSEPALDCPAVLDLSRELLDMTVKGKKLGKREAADLELQAVAACAKTQGAKTDLSDYHANAGAADVEALRLALGYDKVNLWGVANGTRLALEVLRDTPAGVRSVVLDSVVPPEADTIREGPANFARALDVLFKACAADKGCNAAYPKLQQTFRDAVTRLNKTPLSFKTTDPFTGKSYDVLLDGDDLVGLVQGSLAITDLLPLLPMMINGAAKGDPATVSAVLGAMVGVQSFVSDGAVYSSLCHDEIPFATQRDVNAAAAKYPELAGYFEYALTGELAFPLCQAWAAGKADVADAKPVTSAVPALVLAGTYDPIAPPAWGQATARNLEKAYFFEYPGLGDALSTEPCPAEMMAAFLKNPAKAPDAACIKKLAQPGWRIPGHVKLVPYRQPSMGIAGVVPEGWQEGDTGAFARSREETDPTTLLVQAVPMTAKALTDLVAKNLGVKGSLQSSNNYKSKSVAWTLYAIKASGSYTDMAVGESDGLALLVLLQSLPDERETLIDAVFAPAMDALAPVTGPAVDAANLFLQAMKNEDYAAATALMTADLLAAGGGAKGLEAWLKEHKVEPKSWVLAARDVADDKAHLVGLLTLPDNSQITLAMDLLPVTGKWLVNGFEVK